MAGKHIAKPTRQALIDEANAKYGARWAELQEAKRVAEASGSPIHAQLASMSGNEITRDFDREYNAAMKVKD